MLAAVVQQVFLLIQNDQRSRLFAVEWFMTVKVRKPLCTHQGEAEVNI